MTTLREPFDVTHQKKVKTAQGEISLTYVSWSQVADRLDDVAPGWSFTIRQLGDDWCWGQLTVNGATYDNIGYAENAEATWKKEALKDAVSDALKRCAALAGVGRYLYDKDSPAPRQNGSSAPQRPQTAPTPIRSSTTVPEDLDWDSLSATPPTGQVAPRSEGVMWSKELFNRAESAQIDKRTISDTAKKMFGKDKWKVTDLTDGERFALAVELGVA